MATQLRVFGDLTCLIAKQLPEVVRMAMGTTVFRIRIELIFRRCWNLITPSRFAAFRPNANSMERLIVLDAKYRIADGLNEALSSIHMYRDALVREVQAGKIEGIVSAAYLLSPAAPTLHTSYRETSLPGRLFHPGYRGAFRFGAVTLRPGMSVDHIRKALRTVIADSVDSRQSH